MNMAFFSFLGRLQDFLKPDQRGKKISVEFRGRQSIKHLVESLGVPHPEIGVILVNGQEGSLSTITQDADQVEVYPVPNGCPIAPRFLLDGHLGRLTAYLRMLGLDCLYQNDYDDDQLAKISQREGRILLSRDRRLLMRTAVTYGYCLRSLDSLQQLNEVIQRFDLRSRFVPFHRCLRCNHPLETVPKEIVLDRLEPLTSLYFHDFKICPSCGQIYWKGSHYEKMQKLVDAISKKKD
jgi:uncharacterized protein